ncbi:MAG: glycerophosphodiester phosphodiesterase [Clostridia bacterium]|nr:glycerophosphodiester phosphodiesterase [Clostridia bacterium]
MIQQIYAHRGASAYAPENTLEAFDMAAQMGAHGVELDVHITKDGELVVAHDESIDRVSNGTGLIRNLTLAELKQFAFNKTHPEFANAKMPTLKEVFELLKPTGLCINIELKNSIFDYPDLERKTIELAARENMLNRVLFSSFNHHSMKRIKDIDAGIRCGLLYEACMIKPWAYAVAVGADALHPHYSAVLTPGGTCGEAHKAGISVNPWTVNKEEDIRRVLAEGADIVITNYPDIGLNCLNS